MQTANDKTIREEPIRDIQVNHAAGGAVRRAGALALAQDAETEKAIEKYRAMLREDPWSNPGFLDADRGEALWTTARGPKNVTLEQCDLGKGPARSKARSPSCRAISRTPAA